MAPLTIADVTATIRYAQSVMPLCYPPELKSLYTTFYVRLYQVPVDVFHAALAVNDDLPWEVDHWPLLDDQYWSARLALSRCDLLLYTVQVPIDAEVAVIA